MGRQDLGEYFPGAMSTPIITACWENLMKVQQHLGGKKGGKEWSNDVKTIGLGAGRGGSRDARVEDYIKSSSQT